jgi:hypothetical protein
MRQIGKELFTFQKLMKMWLWGGIESPILLLFYYCFWQQKNVGRKSSVEKVCLTKHFSGRVYLHNGQTSFSVTRFPIFDPSAHTVPAKVDCSGKRLTWWSVGKFEDFETHFRVKFLAATHIVGQLYGVPMEFKENFKNIPTDHQSFSRAIYFRWYFKKLKRNCLQKF